MRGADKHSRIGHCCQWMIGLLLLGFVVYLVLPGYRTQLLDNLPLLLLLLACPLMHIFMHRSHGGKRHNPERLNREEENHD